MLDGANPYSSEEIVVEEKRRYAHACVFSVTRTAP